eukprot:CAMPEP_0184646712 /NCGR_PEP_ID=MMETSP0308-20130426/3465_1 /TAXON_ID=38269 /ORGANISM="Gloeochaete witrockiana, Strain SAG 46.84" /LENGTH=76 /DNA_ID=CAMNT_0027076989 /DNA_START=53 /DNA_END=280 /DNA_ORIENTATION=+
MTCRRLLWETEAAAFGTASGPQFVITVPPEVFETRDFCSSHRTGHSLSGKPVIGCFVRMGFCQPMAGFPDGLCPVL